MGKEEISMSPHKTARESFHLVQNEAETTVSKCPAVGRTVPLAMGLEQSLELT